MTSPAALSTTSSGLLDQLLRRLVMGKLRQCRGGTIVVEENAAATRLGTAGDLEATVRVNDQGFYRRLLLGGSLAAADAYVRGQWDCDDLTTLFQILLRNQSAADKLEGPWLRLGNWLQRCLHRWRANTKAGSRRNIRAHYDLGNDFFQCWLDDTWAYSCGIFTSPRATLREASVEKFDRACRKLDLRTDDHLLEIGTGWGRKPFPSLLVGQFRAALRRLNRSQTAEPVSKPVSEGGQSHFSLDHPADGARAEKSGQSPTVLKPVLADLFPQILRGEGAHETHDSRASSPRHLAPACGRIVAADPPGLTDLRRPRGCSREPKWS